MITVRSRSNVHGMHSVIGLDENVCENVCVRKDFHQILRIVKGQLARQEVSAAVGADPDYGICLI